jgi:arabinofuranosyltransferase
MSAPGELDVLEAPGADRAVADVHSGAAELDAAASTLSQSVASWIVLAVPLLIVMVGAWNYRWVQEDALIDFRIINNVMAGHGPVFNVGERVEAYSDPLWLFTIAGFHKVFPFLTLEWLSVLFGLFGTAAGVILSGRAIQRFGSTRSDGVIIPVGLVIFSVVAGVWEFATSGLEMGMVFGWIGLSFWLLVRVERRRTSAVICGFVVGLGSLIRPELILMAFVILVGLAVVVASPGWKGSASLWHRWIAPLVAAAILPALYELFRMAYFGMLVSNSSLAKSAAGSDIPQGAYYVWNFVSTYALWAPFLLVLPLMIPRTWRWWSTGDYAGCAVVATPVVAGLVDALYVLHLGGDYMESRLLLPGFFCLCIVVYVQASQFRSILIIPLVGVAVWATMGVGWFRYDLGNAWDHNMHDERGNWIADTGEPHPIDVSGYLRLVALGPVLKEKAEATQPGSQSMLVLSNPGAIFILPSNRTPTSTLDKTETTYIGATAKSARSSLPFRFVLNLDNIGAIAYLAGPQVYIYDALSLANPIGSHTTIAVRGIPGHEKSIGPQWMIARFGTSGETYSTSKWLSSPLAIAAARSALDCRPLSAYLHAITAPLTFSQAMANIVHAPTFTTMTFSPDPNDAKQQLCR